MSKSILVCGASARAAAFSCLRAGFTPVAADCFADSDLATRCVAIRVNDYPSGLLKIVKSRPADCWMYTGGLENHPSLVDRMAAHLPLLGVRGEGLRQVRDPWRLRAVLERNELLYPAICRAAPSTPGASWLLKPLKSCGGTRIRCAPDSPATAEKPRGWYFQEYLEGQPMSAAYVAASGRAVLLGACRQLIGQEWTGAGGFQYCGSLGPLELSALRRSSLNRLGNVVAAAFQLQGVFGIDTIQRGENIWTLEVNPRYTSSMELLERGLSINVAALHAAACAQQRLPDDAPHYGAMRFGKAIVFARRSIVVNRQFGAWAERSNDSGNWPQAADLPRCGETIAAGHPVTTVFAAADTSDAVLAELRTQVECVQQLLGC